MKEVIEENTESAETNNKAMIRANPTIIRLRRRLNNILLVVGGSCLVLLMFLGFGDVFARYFFGASIVQREELFRIGLIVIFATSFPVITMRHEHLDVDLLDNLFSGALKKVQFFFIDLIVAASCGVMAYWMWDKSGRISRLGREVMFEELGLQQSYFAKFLVGILVFIAIIMVMLACLHIVSIFFKDLEDDIAEIRHRLTL